MAQIRIQTTQNIELTYELAGVGDRLAAYLIDLSLYLAYGILILLLDKETDLLSAFDGWMSICWVLPILTYQLACEVLLNGQSIGKKVRRIRVVSMDGRQPTWGQYAIRWIFRIVDDMIGSGIVAIICIATTEKAQRIGDLLAGTTVVRTEPPTKFHETIHAKTEEGYVPVFENAMLLSDYDISLLKEVINLAKKEPGRHLAVIQKAAHKTAEILKSESNIEPIAFLETVVRDYNHLTGSTEA